MRLTGSVSKVGFVLALLLPQAALAMSVGEAYRFLLEESTELRSNECRMLDEGNSQAPDEAMCSARNMDELLALAAGYDAGCVARKARALAAGLKYWLVENRKQRQAAYAALSSVSTQDLLRLYDALRREIPRRKRTWIRKRDFIDSLGMYAETASHLSADELLVLQTYFEQGYARINRALRAGGALAGCVAPLVSELTAILSRTTQPYAGVIWRGMILTEEQAAPFRVVGNEMTWDGFSSSSLDRRVGEEFAGTPRNPKWVNLLLKIHSKSCVDARGVSRNLSEREVLCLPGTRVRVVGFERANTDHHETLPAVVLEEI